MGLMICMSSFGQHFGHLATCGGGGAELTRTAPVPIQDSSRRDEQCPQQLSPRHFDFSPTGVLGGARAGEDVGGGIIGHCIVPV